MTREQVINYELIVTITSLKLIIKTLKLYIVEHNKFN